MVNFPDSFVAVAASGVGDSFVDDFESDREASDTGIQMKVTSVQPLAEELVEASTEGSHSVPPW